jgi:glycine dehydrogenase subunit 1
LGKTGIRQLDGLCYHKAHYAAERVAALDGYQVIGSKPFFQEFVVRCPAPVRDINNYLLTNWGLIGGFDLGRDYPHLENHMLVCVTEVIAREEIDGLANALAGAAEEVGS